MPQRGREPYVKSTLGLVPSFVRRRFGRLLRLAPDEGDRGVAKEPAGIGRIFIADDQHAIRRVAQFTLSRLGYKAESAASALEAVELYRQNFHEANPFDCV